MLLGEHLGGLLDDLTQGGDVGAGVVLAKAFLEREYDLAPLLWVQPHEGVEQLVGAVEVRFVELVVAEALVEEEARRQAAREEDDASD